MPGPSHYRGSMIFIFGMSGSEKGLGSQAMTCPGCGAFGANRISKVTRRISLFFIPLIPVGSRYVSTCPNCGQSYDLDSAQGRTFDRGDGGHGAPPGRRGADPYATGGYGTSPSGSAGDAYGPDSYGTPAPDTSPPRRKRQYGEPLQWDEPGPGAR